MDKATFIERISKEYKYAISNLDKPNNTIDLRASWYPYRTNIDNWDGVMDNVEELWEKIKDAEEWYVDLYENDLDEYRAEFTDCCVASWQE